MSNYQNLSDADKIRLAQEFVAVGATIPEPIREFLVKQGLYDRVLKPNGD